MGAATNKGCEDCCSARSEYLLPQAKVNGCLKTLLLVVILLTLLFEPLHRQQDPDLTLERHIPVEHSARDEGCNCLRSLQLGQGVTIPCWQQNFEHTQAVTDCSAPGNIDPQ